jgi:hypothetical protein
VLVKLVGEANLKRAGHVLTIVGGV